MIRIRCDAKKAEINLGNKFGCDPDHEAKELINLTKKLGLHLHGFSFHVGSLCREITAYCRGIKICNNLIDYAKLIGCNEVCLIDIGGGFPGETDANIQEVSTLLFFLKKKPIQIFINIISNSKKKNYSIVCRSNK